MTVSILGRAEVVLSGDTCLLKWSDGTIGYADAGDYLLLKEYGWLLKPDSRTRYVRAWRNQKDVFLHRLLAGAQKGDIVDHIDGNGLNNRRSNLRKVTAQQSAFNRGPRQKGYKGVKAEGNRFVAQIRKGGRTVRIGSFSTEREAAEAYNKAAVELQGEHARLNVLKDTHS